MSGPEVAGVLVGLFSGLARELHEGKMLSPEPGVGPMFGFPGATAPTLETHRGTLRIASELGAAHFHPTVYVPRKSDGLRVQVGFPLLGDLLWFFEDDNGIYVRNWTIKDTLEDFERPFQRRGIRRAPPPRDVERLKARLAIEEVYYSDVGVVTSRVALEEIPSTLFNNLRRIYPVAHLASPISEEVRRYIVHIFRERIPRGVPVIETVRALVGRLGRDLKFYLDILFQAIWHREIEVDMWSAIVPEAPLLPSERDVLDVYARWFARSPA
jgi:hypothetical protein